MSGVIGQEISAHDRAAANHARRFTLTVCKSDDHCSQSWDESRLTQAEVEARKSYYRTLYAGSPFTLGFDVEADGGAHVRTAFCIHFWQVTAETRKVSRTSRGLSPSDRPW